MNGFFFSCYTIREVKEMKSYTTKKEREHPIGKLMTGLGSEEIVKRLKESDFIAEDGKLTRKGKEYCEYQFQKLDSVQRIMMELFILSHHGHEISHITYKEES